MASRTTNHTLERNRRFEAALDAAFAAARDAVAGMRENPLAMDGGFAWAVTHDPAFNRWCALRAKETKDQQRYGSKHWAAGRLFWPLAHAPVQPIGVHEVGARAFRNALAHALQIRVETGSRLD